MSCLAYTDLLLKHHASACIRSELRCWCTLQPAEPVALVLQEENTRLQNKVLAVSSESARISDLEAANRKLTQVRIARELFPGSLGACRACAVTQDPAHLITTVAVVQSRLQHHPACGDMLSGQGSGRPA